MSQKKIITIFGATGAQGGGLARAILNDKNSEFAVRAVTRDANTDKAKALAALGAEVIVANIDDPESVKHAMEGAYGAYCVTFFWDHFSPEKEGMHVKYMADAAKATGLKHVIWSTLEHTRLWVPITDDRMPTLMEKYTVPHFDGKGESDRFFTEAGVPTTFLLASFYWDNLIHFGMGPKRGADGKLSITFPMGDKKLSGIAGEDIGKCAYGIFKLGADMIGKRIGIAGGEPTCQQMADSLTKALGEQVTYNEVSPAAYRSFGFPGAEDLGNMFQFYQEFEEQCTKTRDVNFSKELNPELQSFDMWLSHNISRMPIS
ncbi:MAG: NmrA/HSCARG family protein [Saprospiraceae bacterium]|nr:NmrA/HSCARG family protein [Saprospiraceae bacterium]